jgi:hypothetical protein
VTKDAPAVDRLRAKTGRTVTVIDDSAVPSAGLSGYSLIIVSVNANDGTIGTKLTNSTTPVLSWDDGFYGRLKLATSTGTQGSQTRLEIVETGHPATSGVGSKPVVLSSSGTLPTGTPPATALKLARSATSSSKWSIFAVRPGGKLTDGKAAAGCRVAFAAPSDWKIVAPAGWQLFDQTVAWTLAGCA